MDLSLGYDELPPPSALRGALECLWVRVVPSDSAATSVLPDSCSDLIWQLDYGAFVAGPDTEPVRFDGAAGTVLVGARFLPGAGGPALATPLNELRNQRVDVTDVRPDLARRLPNWLTPAEALTRVADVAAELVATAAEDRTVRAAAQVLADPAARVDTLADDLGVSERQLRRRFHTTVGYGPKTLQRILRFRRFLAGLDAAGPRADLAQLALATGYADQAHLTRECGQLGGVAPTTLARARAA